MIKYFSILRINWINALEYRANALLGLFAILSGLFIEYQMWSLIFESNNTTTIKMKPDPRQTKLKKYKNVKRPNEFEKGKPRFYGEK